MKIFISWTDWKRKRATARTLKKQKKANFNSPNDSKNAQKILAETKAKIKIKKTKPPRDKFSQRAEEFPVKMVKEVNKIRWATKENLTKKYLEVLIFIILFAVFFALVDWGFQALFSLIKVI